MKQLLSGVSHLHSLNIAHRDLKPEYILLNEAENIQQLKIIDFGTAHQWTAESTAMHERVGTLNYMAPEVLRANEQDPATYYNELCDMWSLGVIAYLLCCFEQPFLQQIGQSD